MAKKFSELTFYPNAKKKGDPEESGGTIDMKNGMPSQVKEEKKSDQMDITHRSGRKETVKVHMTGSDYHIVKNKHGAQYTVDKKGNVLHGHGNTNEGYNDNRTGFAKKKREDDEYHTPDPVATKTHKVAFNVSKDGGEKHSRTVTISNSTKSSAEAHSTAKAHLEKQGYKIHEDATSHAPVAPTIPRKYIKGTPEHKAYKASKQKSHLGLPTGKYNEETELDEKINLAASKMGDVIKDFQKSDAPQFAGKSAEKKRQMAIAAKLQADGETKKEETMLNFASFMEALKGNQHKIDKNKNGKVDAHDFKLLRKEETEQIDELSKGTLNSYVASAQQDNKDHADSRRSGDKDEAKYAKDRMVKRSTGIGAAKNRLNKEETEVVEEAEQIEERNKENAMKRKMMDASRGAKYKLNNTVPDADPEHKTAQAHNKAIGRALRNEETEEIEENAFDWKSKKSEPSSGRYEIKRVNGRTMVTRKYNPDTGHSTGTDDEDKPAEKRGRGRPAGSKNR
jgi:hypothetical protein